MKRILLLLCLFVILLNEIKAQKSYEKLLIGKWQGVRKEIKSGPKTLRNGEIIKEVGIYEFQKEGGVLDYTIETPPKKYKYSITKDLLIMGKLSFKIEKLDKKNLVIVDFDPSNPNAPFVYRHYFIRLNPPKK
jgi:hypothetical protein